jgi:flagellar motor switch protein FliM
MVLIPVIVCAFMVQMPNHDPVSFDVVYPLQTLKPISSQLRSRVQNEFAQDDRSWKDKLQNAVLSIPLTLTAELGHPKTSIGKLMKASEGDVFAMGTPEHVLVKVAGEKVFFADIGKVGPKCCNINEKENSREWGKKWLKKIKWKQKLTALITLGF